MLTIRPIAADDETDWRRLWTAYLEFYESGVPEEVYRATFARLLDPGPARSRTGSSRSPTGRRRDWSTSSSTPTTGGSKMSATSRISITDPAFRGKGVGRALIEAVYEAADERGAPSVYWLTQDFNETARALYDRIANLTPFIKYQRQE